MKPKLTKVFGLLHLVFPQPPQKSVWDYMPLALLCSICKKTACMQFEIFCNFQCQTTHLENCSIYTLVSVKCKLSIVQYAVCTVQCLVGPVYWALYRKKEFCTDVI